MIIAFRKPDITPGDQPNCFVLASEIATLTTEDGVPTLVMKNGAHFHIVGDVQPILDKWFAFDSGGVNPQAVGATVAPPVAPVAAPQDLTPEIKWLKEG